jgi:hypothetical protein
MIGHIKKFGAICALLAVAFPAISQDDETTQSVVVSDFETWSSLGLKMKFTKKFSLGLDQEFRLEENSSAMDQYFTNVGLNYKVHKRFSLGADYRFIRNNDPDGYENRSRFSFDAAFNHKLERLQLSYRLRLQTRNDHGVSTEEGDYAVNKIRFRLKADYNIKKWKLDPYLSAEIFRSSQKYTLSSVDNFRMTLGTSYKLKNFGRVSAFYRVDHQLGISYPVSTYILGVSLRYNLNFIKSAD